MPLTTYYVNPALNSNTGDGLTVGTAFGDLQYALSSTTLSAGGDEFRIMNTAAEVLTAVLDVTTRGTPTATAPIAFRGCKSDGNYLDPGDTLAEINANGGAAIPSSICWLRDLNIHNGGSAILVTLSNSATMINCRIANTSGTGVSATGVAAIMSCEFTDLATGLNLANTGAIAYGNYFKFGGIRNFTNACLGGAIGCIIERNIFSIGTSGNAINQTAARQRIISNSILASSGSGNGITSNISSNFGGAVIVNNLLEGFGSGSAINGGSTTNYVARYAGNAFFNNTTNVLNPGVLDDIENFDNETLGASPFAKSGADTFANRFIYFAPTDTGNIYGGAIQ